MASCHFHWGLKEPSVVIQSLESAYDEAIHWRRNSFTVPNESASKSFACELTRLFCTVGDGCGSECIALKAVFAACILLLQKPSQHPKLRTIPLIWNIDYHSGQMVISLNLSQRAALFNSICPSAQTSIPTLRSFQILYLKAAPKLITVHKHVDLLKLDDLLTQAM